jgi:pyruvate dehydrogenase E2 component (dihydrolipoamide acetyltransferase)
VSESSETHDGFGPAITCSLSRIQQISATRLHAAWTQFPHVTHHEEADVTALDEFRRRGGGADQRRRLTLLTYVARATVLALKEYPKFCASLDSTRAVLVLKQYVNLGVAVETPKGLVVAVVPGADRLSVEDLGARINEFAGRGRDGVLKPSEMEGGCMTISSLGNLGGIGFTPIINPPDVAILGVSQARVRVAWVDGAAAPRLMLPLSLSYDHRVIDGAEAARFCMYLRDALGQPDRMR